MFSVPQFIDVEDKIAGPLTWRQLLWMIALGAIEFILYTLFDQTLFIIISIPLVLFFIALAFYRPGGFSMASFIGNAVFFVFRPKIAIWERPAFTTLPAKKPEDHPGHAASASPETKVLTREKIAELARMIDNQSKV